MSPRFRRFPERLPWPNEGARLFAVLCCGPYPLELLAPYYPHTSRDFSSPSPFAFQHLKDRHVGRMVCSNDILVALVHYITPQDCIINSTLDSSLNAHQHSTRSKRKSYDVIQERKAHPCPQLRHYVKTITERNLNFRCC